MKDVVLQLTKGRTMSSSQDYRIYHNIGQRNATKVCYKNINSGNGLNGLTQRISCSCSGNVVVKRKAAARKRSKDDSVGNTSPIVEVPCDNGNKHIYQKDSFAPRKSRKKRKIDNRKPMDLSRQEDVAQCTESCTLNDVNQNENTETSNHNPDIVNSLETSHPSVEQKLLTSIKDDTPVNETTEVTTKNAAKNTSCIVENGKRTRLNEKGIDGSYKRSRREASLKASAMIMQTNEIEKSRLTSLYEYLQPDCSTKGSRKRKPSKNGVKSEKLLTLTYCNLKEHDKMCEADPNFVSTSSKEFILNWIKKLKANFSDTHSGEKFPMDNNTSDSAHLNRDSQYPDSSANHAHRPDIPKFSTGLTSVFQGICRPFPPATNFLVSHNIPSPHAFSTILPGFTLASSTNFLPRYHSNQFERVSGDFISVRHVCYPSHSCQDITRRQSVDIKNENSTVREVCDHNAPCSNFGTTRASFRQPVLFHSPVVSFCASNSCNSNTVSSFYVSDCSQQNSPDLRSASTLKKDTARSSIIFRPVTTKHQSSHTPEDVKGFCSKEAGISKPKAINSFTISKSPYPQKRYCWQPVGDPVNKSVIISPDKSSKELSCFCAIRHEKYDEVIRVRDCILVRSETDKSVPYIAKVLSMWRDPSSHEIMISLLWFYHVDHTSLSNKNPYLPDEVFASRHFDITNAACIDDKCYVLTLNEYSRYKKQENNWKKSSVNDCVVAGIDYPRRNKLPDSNTSPQNVFFCRYIYDFRMKRLLKNRNRSF